MCAQERLHFLLESAFDGEMLSHKFLKEFDSWQAWDTNPLYAMLHEAIYCQGAPSRWAAHRVRGAETYAAAFDAAAAAAEGRPVMFTGEMVFPWMFEDYAELRRVRERGGRPGLCRRLDAPLRPRALACQRRPRGGYLLLRGPLRGL